MSGVDATAYVMRLAMRTPAHKLALLAVAARCDQNYSCYPSRALIAGEALISDERAKTVLRELRRDGFLSARQRYRENGSKTSNRYFVHGPWDRWNETGQPFPEIEYYADQDDRYAAIREGEFIPRPAPKSEKSDQQGGGVAGNPSPGVADNPSQGGADNPSVTRHCEPATKNHADALPDAVGQGLGGFARAGTREGAAGETGGGVGGCAASGNDRIPRQQQDGQQIAGTGPVRSVKTTPRRMPSGYDEVRAAVPAGVARPGTGLYVGLRRAIADLLTGNPDAGIPARTPGQVIARINRRWYGEHGPERSAAGYTPATTSDADRPITSASAWLAAAILGQDCPDPACEDGTLIGAGAPCTLCPERRAAREAARTAREAAEQQITADLDRLAADTATHQEVAAEYGRGMRAQHAQYGLTGEDLDQAVAADLERWRQHCPPPTIDRPAPRTTTPLVPAAAAAGAGPDGCVGWGGAACGRRAVTSTGRCTTCHGHATNAQHPHEAAHKTA